VEISNFPYVESKGKNVTVLNYTPCQEVTAKGTGISPHMLNLSTWRWVIWFNLPATLLQEKNLLPIAKDTWRVSQPVWALLWRHPWTLCGKQTLITVAWSMH